MRMKPITGVLALALTGVLLAGCSATSTNTKTASPTPTASATTQAAVAVKGDTAIPSGQYITDAAGKYETVVLAPKSTALNPKLWYSVSATAKKQYTTAQIASAVKYAFSFAVSEGLDSIALDGNAAGWATWKKDVAPKYILAKERAAILKSPTGTAEIDRSLLIYDDESNVFPTLIRDGKPRFTTIEYEPKTAAITAGNDAGTQFIGISAVIDAKARASDAEVIKSALALNKNKTGATKAKLLADYPQYKDGKGVNTVTLRYSFAYYLVNDGNGWVIGGEQVNPNYDVFGADLDAQAAAAAASAAATN